MDAYDEAREALPGSTLLHTSLGRPEPPRASRVHQCCQQEPHSGVRCEWCQREGGWGGEEERKRGSEGGREREGERERERDFISKLVVQAGAT